MKKIKIYCVEILILALFFVPSLNAKEKELSLHEKPKDWSVSLNFLYEGKFFVLGPHFGAYIDSVYKGFCLVSTFSGFRGLYEDHYSFSTGIGYKYDFIKSDKMDLSVFQDILFELDWGDYFKVNYDGTSYVYSLAQVHSIGVEFSTGKRKIKFNTGFVISYRLTHYMSIEDPYNGDIEIRRNIYKVFPGISFYNGFKF